MSALRPPIELESALAAAARREGMSDNELAARLIREGLAAASHPGIIFKGGPSGRRAALAGGPDVWEIVADFRLTEGPEQRRIHEAAARLGLDEIEVVTALNYAREFADEIESRIEMNDAALARVAATLDRPSD